MSAEILRLFLAVPLHHVFLQEIKDILHPLRAGIPGVKWVDPGQVHLTLHFFGDVPASEVDGIDQAMKRILPRFAPFRIRLNGLGGFPDLRRPHVLWVGVSGENRELFELQESVRREVEALGYAADGRAFRPHATLGRVKKIPGALSCQEEIEKMKLRFPTEIKTLDHFVLYQSRLLPDGACYETVKTYPLSKAS
jgi:2'-5' RNA ligase